MKEYNLTAIVKYLLTGVFSMEWLNYHHLYYFWTVARAGSISKAAQHLRVSSPAISSQLRSLEESLGEELFLRSGRSMTMSEMGRVVFSYADEIFGLGRELMNTVKERPTGRPPRLLVGVVDVLPKMIAHWLIEPALGLQESVRIVCREGDADKLVTQLAMHELDVVLSDVPINPNIKVKAYSHLLGECGTTFVATPTVAKVLKGPFPQSLHRARCSCQQKIHPCAGIWISGLSLREFVRLWQVNFRTTRCCAHSAKQVPGFFPFLPSSRGN
jgi:LysR family transcriptional activator of nhaA